MMSTTTLRRKLLRNPYWRLTLKAKAAGMPLFWWRQWARALWLTRRYPRLRSAGAVKVINIDDVGKVRLSRKAEDPDYDLSQDEEVRLVRMAQRDVAAKTLGVFVESARRRQRFGSEIEAARSIARSHNAGLKRRQIRAQEQVAAFREAIRRLEGAAC